MRWMVLVLIVFAAACGRDTLPSQCDAERRCSTDPSPVCGSDGEWYDCASVLQCVGVAEAENPSTCGEEPPGECAPLLCDISCENAKQTDENGCELCACVDDEPACPPVEACAAPLEQDANGCDVCPDACPGIPNNCPDECYSEDERGCPMCNCEGLCPDVDPSCELDPNCQLVTDSEGCDACVCGAPPAGQCDRLFCDAPCPNGYLIVDGCPTCECADPCPEVFCDVECPRQLDPATGCESACDCLRDSCPTIECSTRCSNGTRNDANGCPTCECRGTPCDGDEQCALDEHCVISPWAPVTDAPMGECVALELCGDDFQCEDAGSCGFYFRNDCCPPLTTCDANIPACPAVCLLEMGDLP